MKSEINALMENQGLDALWVMGAGDHNPNMVYFTGLHHISIANLFILKGKEPVLLHQSMERGEAQKTGLKTISMIEYPLSDFIKMAEGDIKKAQGLFYKKIFTDLGLTQGRVAISGMTDAGSLIGRIDEINNVVPEIEFTSINQDDPFKIARMTKDKDEVDRIRAMGKVTTEIVAMTADYLSSLSEKQGFLIGKEGRPVTVADVKQRIRLWMAERNVEAPEETIFALGRDAGIPHSAGNPNDILRTGVPIVFDFFPCEAGGGYFYDFTRTWCLGYAPPDVQALYDQVLHVYKTIAAELKINMPFSHYQKRTCELFASFGHPTIMEDPSIEEGYVHSIGHGIGLAVHEEPFSGIDASPFGILKPGVTFTLEPGLYYPDRNMGVRLEDSYVATQTGEFIRLADYPMDLVIPLKK